MMLSLLAPKGNERIGLPSDREVDIPICRVLFTPWEGEPISDDYGGKAVINYKGVPLFAELVVLNMLKQDGWDGVWVDNFRSRFITEMPKDGEEGVVLPEGPAGFFGKYSAQAGNRGCWDLFLWKGGKYLFVECKRKGKDAMRESQLVWLESCLDNGLKTESFFLVEWDIGGIVNDTK